MTAEPKAPVKQTKAATLRAMLETPEGASLEAICRETGWQPHTVRASISMLRKAGYEVDRTAADGKAGGSVYRITGQPVVTA